MKTLLVLLLTSGELAWLPAIGSGPSGEFLLRSAAESVVGIIHTRLDGNGACYFVIYPESAGVAVRRDSTREWGAAGDRCTVKVAKRSESWLHLAITFLGEWSGPQKVYLLERPGGKWYRSGTWTVEPAEVSDENGFPWLKPPKPPAIIVTARSARLVQANGVYELPPWAETITRNGLVMEEGEDYTLSLGRLIPINGAWLPEDFVVARGRAPTQ